MTGIRALPLRAGVVGVLAWSLSVGALVLLLICDDPFPADPGYYADRQYFALHVIIGITSGTAAAVILGRSRHPVGVIAAVISLCFAASAFSLGWASCAAERDWPGFGLSSHGFAAISQPGAFTALAVLPWFVRRDPITDWPTKLAIGLGVGSTGLITLAALMHQQEGAAANPLSGLPGAGAVQAMQIEGPLLTALVVGLLGVVDLIRRGRASKGNGTAWSTLVLGSVLLFATVIQVQFGPHFDWLDPVGVPMIFLSQTLIALSMVVLTLGTWDLDSGRAVPRAATAALLVGVVALLHVLLVALGQSVLPLDDATAGLVSVLLLALVLQPLRQALQRRVDRVMLGGAAEPDRVLAGIGRRLRDHDSDQVLPHLADSLRHSLRLGAIEIAAPGRPVVSSYADGWRADPDEPGRAMPLVVGTRAVGELTAWPLPGRTLEAATRDVLTQTADLVAAAVDLASSHTRLVEVRHEERRMLRRELHDGLGPALAGIGLGLAAAQRRIGHDRDGAERLLAELREEISRRVDDVRLMARSVLPVQLDDGDLAAAVGVLAGRFGDAGMQVDVTCHADGLDTIGQIAIYHVTAEALLNAHRHGRARHVQVTVASGSGGTTSLEIVDDGIGIDPATPRGVGLQSMRERADALGATLVVAPRTESSGTRVRLHVP